MTLTSNDSPAARTISSPPKPVPTPTATGRCDALPQAPPPQWPAPLKPSTTRSPLGLPTVLKPPVNPPRICTNRESTTFGPEDGAKHAQHLQYGTPIWHARYATDRNTIEGFNGTVKDPAYSALADPGRRRIRGYTAQLLTTALITTSTNIRKIRSHLHRHNQPRPHTSRHRTDRRRHRHNLANHHPDTPPATGPSANTH